MTKEITEKYGLDTSSFKYLRNNNCVYVDKTGFIYKLINSPIRTFFLSRPRRFGKSLFLSTLESYFRGEKELFKDLTIYDFEEKWESYPVLHFDLSNITAQSSEKLEKYLEASLQELAQENGVRLKKGLGIGGAFEFLIKDIVKKKKKKVVILIDEYDKGIVEVLDNVSQLEMNQNVLRPFFNVTKSQLDNIRFTFITGVARFRNYTLFSGTNNIHDLSMHNDYAAICGITMDELLVNFPHGIKKLAQDQNLSFDEAVDRLKFKYDGYRFTDRDILVFNPFDILNCLEFKKFNNFWLKSGIPKVFANYFPKIKNFDLIELTKIWVKQDEMEGTFNENNPIPLLFQSGYLTIKEIKGNLYRLDAPNGEAREALVNELFPTYLGISENSINPALEDLKYMLDNGDIDGLMAKLKSIISCYSYHLFEYKQVEKTYHVIVLSIFLMLGVDVRSEIAISGGRIDMVASNRHYVYVMEFKLRGTAQSALAQIDSRGYALPWSADGRKVFKIGIAFSPRTRTISKWEYTAID